QALRCTASEDGSVKLVSSFAGNHVDLDAADGSFSRKRTRRVGNLLHQAVVEIEPGLIAGEGDVLNPDAVHHKDVVIAGGPMNLQRGLLHSQSSAYVRR